MSVFRHTADIPHTREAVTGWYASPGAIQRLSPDWNSKVLQEPSDGLNPGSVTKLLMGVPWADDALPGKLPIRAGARWRAVHTEYTPGESFTDVMDRGPLRSWRHDHSFADAAGGGTTVSDKVTYELPGGLQNRIRLSARVFEGELERVFGFRTRNTRADLDFHARLRELRAEPMTVAISGASGLVGTQLSALLRSGGHRVITLKRRTGYSGRIGADTIAWDPSQGELDARLLAGVDVVVNLSGAGIAGPFTDKHKEEVLQSRLDATGTIVRAMREAVEHDGPRTLVNASASGYYGHDAGEVDEQAGPGDDFLAEVCRRWEDAAWEAEQAGIRVAMIRTGLVMNSAGGLLAAQLPLYFAGGGGPLGGGEMWQPWISLDDLVQIYAWVAANPEVSGPVNAAAPGGVRQREFAKTLGKVIHRPAVIPTPAAAPAALLGKQGARELALSSARLVPAVLESHGYEFRFTRLEDALRHTLGK
ncbi:TIGR01777 family oxidoreductase [Rothia sp. AR01]|uniref:TIGR01777 family oxidoreductase n=1 Tax=Rothia santali TaxID=2949643 RepID=A0A9X2H9W2_9MICC|nr:TIGR01777 family oxidoreductase [Rothia santali]MCP3425684.1 TIGR01777 family oxidoreductase [Rothia santali]